MTPAARRRLLGKIQSSLPDALRAQARNGGDYCSCSDQPPADAGRGSPATTISEDDERTFDPRAPRSSYSLYPLEYLLETKLLGPEGASSTSTGPFALICQYCHWSSREIGIEFDRHSGIHSQLSRVNNGGEQKITAKEVKERRKETHDDTPLPDDLVDADLQFTNLKSFYQSQLADVGSALGGISVHDGGFSSPAALSRIMSLYTGRGGAKSQQGVPYVMREALNTDEGLKLAHLNDSSSIKKLTTGGWDCTVGTEQKENQLAGRFPSTVTVLCPQFEIDANTDMWDDALKDDGKDRNDSSNQVEVGKIWERGRNWVSIILEVVPASLVSDPSKLPLKDGEDVLEIPMFVRMEWESDVQNDMGTPLGRERDGREKRELAYWCVLGVGKIAQE
ncbi:hypothetical protein MY4038_008811 [Beauveria bassiana]